MTKINKITLSNFKFFKDQETIVLNGKHLLLYGENGSGKSSLFYGIYTLLEASMKTSVETDKYFKPFISNEESLVNIFANELGCIASKKTHYNSFIEIEDDNNTQLHLSLLDSQICDNSDAIESRKATDFINYQSIFEFQRFKNSEKSNLYEVFVNSILPYISFSSINLKGRHLSNAFEMWHEYQKGPGTTTNNKDNIIQVKKKSQDYIDFKKFESHFISCFQDLIDFINTNSADIIKKLGYDIEFLLYFYPPTHQRSYKDYKYELFRVNLIIKKYNGSEIEIKRPHSFLNEAKMAAVAIAIRLAILKHRVSSEAPNALKVLVLDDLMISLDMSNRDKLADLLLKEFSKTYQILFLTHDNSLYNFIDYKIKQYSQDSKWLRKAMYVGECNKTKLEIPVIIDSHITYIEKAHKYFAAKDYTTTAVYIRQAIEKIFSEALPDEVKQKIDEKMKNKFISLETLWQQIKTIYTISPDVQQLFEQSKLMIYNPAAHHQRLSQPIYKEELKRAFSLINELIELKLYPETILIEKNKRLIFTHPSENYSFEFELKADMIEKNGVRNDPKCKIHTWSYNNIQYYDFSTGEINPAYTNSSPKFSTLKSGLFRLPFVTAVDEDCFLDNTTIQIQKDKLRNFLK